jgi:hypothetical protein
MICPQCNLRNDLGVQRCRRCGQPFTREALAAAGSRQPDHARQRRAGYSTTWDDAGTPGAYAAPPAWPTADARLPRDDFVPARRRGGLRSGCLLLFGFATILVVGILVLLLATSRYVVQPMVRDAALDDIRTGVRGEVDAQLATQLVEAPSGEVVISEAEINQHLAATGNLGPLDDVSVRITPEALLVDLAAYGLDGTYRTNVRAENGAVVLEGGSLDGPLAYIIPESDLVAAVNEELARALAQAGYRVDAIELGDGQLVVAVSR